MTRKNAEGNAAKSTEEPTTSKMVRVNVKPETIVRVDALKEQKTKRERRKVPRDEVLREVVLAGLEAYEKSLPKEATKKGGKR